MNDDKLYIEDFAYLLHGRTSGHIKVFCPICHEQRNDKRDKSLSIDCATLAYKCHYCGATGVLRSRMDETIRRINKETRHMAKTYRKPSVKPNLQPKLDEGMVEYFKGRGISEQTLLEAKVTKETYFFPQDQAKRGCIAFNYYVDGEHINTKFRTRDKHFTFIGGAKVVPYNLDSIAPSAYKDGEQKICIITEGEADTLTYIECGYKHVISVPAGANTNLEWMDDYVDSHFDKLDLIYVSTDGDKKGIEAKNELVRRFGAEICKVVEYPDGCKDINEVLVKYGKEKVIECFENAIDVKIQGIEELYDVENELDYLFQNGLQKGATIGIKEVDDILSFKTGLLSVVTGIPSHGKALSLDTPLPTPNGWTTMGEVKIGDKLFDENGDICTVTYTTPIQYNRNCYKMYFSDGSEIVCDEDHLWVTRDDKARRSLYQHLKRVKKKGTDKLLPRGTDQSYKRTYPQERTTKEILDTLYVENGTRCNHAIKVQGKLSGISRDIELHPYVLGVWLAEGTTHYGSITTGDVEIVDRIRNIGFTVNKRKDKYGYGVLELKSKLKRIGVLDNKRIPQMYMRLPYEDRLELMRGMMDGDGTCHKDGTCSYCSSIKELAEDFYELVMTMGLKATITSKVPTCNGVKKKTSYNVNFRPDFKCFTLQRKNCRIREKYADDVNWRYIRKIEKVESVPVRCIQVDSPNHMYLCGKSMIPTHNTYWLNYMLVRLNILHDWKVAFFSPEFYPVTLHISQIIETLGGARFNSQNYNKPTYDALKEYVNNNFFWIDPDDTDITSVLERGKYLIRKKGIKAFVIDPFNALTDKERKVQKQDEYISEFMQKIRWFARKYDVAIFVVMHPTKQQKLESGLYPVVDLYACKGASEIYDKADIGLTVWRNEYDNYAEMHVTKIKFRHLGEKGHATFVFNVNNGRYVSIPNIESKGGIDKQNIEYDNSNYVTNKLNEIQKQQAMNFDNIDTPFDAYQDDNAPF